MKGTYQIEIVSSDLSQTLTAIQNSDIILSDIRFVDMLRMRACVTRSNLTALKKLLSKRGEEWKILNREGIYWSFLQIQRRPVLLIGITLILLLSIFIPTRVLFVQVEGNAAIAEKSIIETASACGIRFFASRRAVRSEKMKNALLHAMPQLQWAGVNTKGCVAIISVRERKEEPTKVNQQKAGSIVAVRDGIVEEITALSGTPLCKVGQGVKKGQVLISGYTDCGLLLKIQRADGEVIGQTFHQIEAVTPTQFYKRGAVTGKSTKIMLRIGKKIINFSKGSGISDAECVKMYEEKFLTLPGGFALPIALVVETCTYTDMDSVVFDENDYLWMEEACENYQKSIMLAGEILRKKYLVDWEDGTYKLKGKYACKEQLGQIRYEEIMNDYGT